jgi:hypothetical protein
MLDPVLTKVGPLRYAGHTLPQVAAKNRSLFSQNLREGSPEI